MGRNSLRKKYTDVMLYEEGYQERTTNACLANFQLYFSDWKDIVNSWPDLFSSEDERVPLSGFKLSLPLLAQLPPVLAAAQQVIFFVGKKRQAEFEEASQLPGDQFWTSDELTGTCEPYGNYTATQVTVKINSFTLSPNKPESTVLIWLH